MPYIYQDMREWFAGALEVIQAQGIESPGELNYLITQLALIYLQKHGKCFGTINAIIGAMECAKLEFYRRFAAPYEDVKISENGDVYPND